MYWGSGAITGSAESEYPLMPHNHEGFDTGVMLHATNAVSHGYQRILFVADGTDIIVLGESFFNYICAGKLLVSFGIGNALLCHLMDRPDIPSSDDIAVPQSFVIQLYSVSCT